MAQLATPNRLVFPSRRFWIVALDKSSTDSNHALDVRHGLGMMNGPPKALARIFSMNSCFGVRLRSSLTVTGQSKVENGSPQGAILVSTGGMLFKH
jgi:hypothetical protein